MNLKANNTTDNKAIKNLRKRAIGKPSTPLSNKCRTIQNIKGYIGKKCQIKNYAKINGNDIPRYIILKLVSEKCRNL